MRRLSPQTRRGPRTHRTRRRVAPRWRAPALKLGALALAAAVVVGGPIWLYRSGWIARTASTAQARVLAASAEAGLAVREVLVAGRRETPHAAILDALGLRRGDPILGFDPAAAKARLEALAWVRSATVARRLPGTVIVRLTERRPLALWQRRGRLALVDEDGVVIQRSHLERFARLPLIVGEDAPAKAAALFAMLASAPKLKARVVAAVRVGGRRWNLRLDNGVDVRLPEDGAAAAWARLAQMDRRHAILRRDVIAVDLRLPGRLVVKMSRAAAQRARDPGRST